jgi:isopenicillin N synthase-like dioxygenase
MTTATQRNIPIIDIGPFLAGSPEGKQQVAREVGRACEEIGFILVTGHSVPEQLIAKTYNLAREFFDLPVEQKLLVRTTPAGVGYMPIELEALAASLGNVTPADLKESMNVGRDFEQDLWPASPAEARAAWTAYFQALEALAGQIMRIFALALGLSEHYFDDKIDNPNAFFRMINYPNQEKDPEPGQLRAGEHSDYGSLTILRIEDAPGGLQVRDRAGEWVDVTAVPGAFVINIGDMMQHWTNDRWVSTLHRVVNPPRDRRLGSRRQSLVFFHSPNADTLLTCIESCCGPDNPPKYAPVSAGEYLDNKSRRTRETGTGM